MQIKHSFLSRFESFFYAIVLLTFVALIFGVDHYTSKQFVVIQLYGVPIILSALFFGTKGLARTTVLCLSLIVFTRVNNQHEMRLADLVSLGMLAILFLFSGSLAKIKKDLDILSKTLDIKSKALSVHANRLQIINELGHKLVSSSAVDEVVNLALEAVIRLLRVRNASVIILGNRYEKEYFSTTGLDKQKIKTDLIKEFWQTQTFEKDYKTVDLSNNKNKLSSQLKEQGIIMAVGCEIMAEGERIGYISGYSTRKRRFSQNELAFLGILAEEVGISVGNNRLHRGLEKRALMLESLVETSRTLSSPFRIDKIYNKLATIVRNAVSADGCAVLIAKTGSKIVEVAAADGLQLGNSVRVNEDSPVYKTIDKKKVSTADTLFLGKGEGSSLAIPVIYEGAAIGAIYLEYLPGRDKITQHERVLACAIADQAALLINRAKVYEALRKSAMESSVMVEAGTLLNNESSLESKLDALIEKITEILKASKGFIFLSGDSVKEDFYGLNEESKKLAQKLFAKSNMPLIGQITRHNRPLKLSPRNKEHLNILNLMEASKAVAVPIFYEKRLIGLSFFCENEQGNLKMDLSYVNLAKQVADYSAATIHMAKLYSRIEELKKQSDIKASNLQTLLNVAQTISGSLNTRTVLRRTVNLVKQMFAAEAALLALHDKFTGQLVPKISLGLESAMTADLNISSKDFIGMVFQKRKAAKTAIGKNNGDPILSASGGYLNSVIAAPLLTRGKEIGVICLYSKDDTFHDSDLELLSIFASQVALSIDTASLYEKEHQIVETLQRSLLPKAVEINGIELGVLYSPAQVQNEIGGDYYDFIVYDDNHFGVVIGDVCGKGIDAATDTAMARYYLQAFASKYKDPAKVIDLVNRTISKNSNIQLITMMYVVFDLEKREVKYVNAGHPPAFLYSNNYGTLTQMEATGPIVGAIEDASYSSRKLKIEKNDILFLYTDGLTETQNEGELYGEERLAESILENTDNSMNKSVNMIFRKASNWSNGNINDDVAIVGLRVSK